MLSGYAQEEGLPSMTNSVITFDNLLILEATKTASVRSSQLRRNGVIPLVLASTLHLTPPVSMPDAKTISTSRIAFADRVPLRTRLTLREAREMALRTSTRIEEGLQRDREQEARLTSGSDGSDDEA